MSKLIIGLDYSQNSPGLCFLSEEGVRFFNVFNRLKLSKAKDFIVEDFLKSYPVFESMMKAEVTVNIINKKLNTPYSKKNKIEVWEWFQNMQKSIEYLNEIIVSKIVEHASVYDREDVFISLENYSYGSASDNLIQTVSYTQSLINELIRRGIIDRQNIYTFPAPTVKAFIGHGGYDKYDIMMAFTKEEEPKVKMNQFFKYIKENHNILFKEKTKKGKPFKEVITPIDDVIDAYYLAKYLDKEILNKKE
jgi:hypothetical protein